MALLPHRERFLCVLVIAQAVFVSLCHAQQPYYPCPSEECNINYRAQLEAVNEELRQSVEKVNRTLAEQKRLINEWKSCRGNNSTNPGTQGPNSTTSTPSTPSNITGYEAEKVTSLEPCVSTLSPKSSIKGVTQVEGRIFVICEDSDIMRVYNSTTFQQLPNVTLPIPGFPKKYPNYIIGNRFEKTLYLAVAGPDLITGEFYGNDILRTDMSFNWITLSTAKKDVTFNIYRLRVARNGQMMYANHSHILFPAGPTSFSRAINFANYPLNKTSYIQGLVERRNGSFIFFSQLFKYLIHVSSTGGFIENTATGTVAPTNDAIFQISDMEQGPNEMLLISDSYRDRIIIFDAATNKMTELITKSSGNLWGPYYLSYDRPSQILVVGEYPERSNAGSSVDNNSLKIFRIIPKP